MGLHAREPPPADTRRVNADHAERRRFGRTDAGARWDVSASRASSGAMPRLGALALAIVVVALLTIGLHVLFQ